MRYSRLEILDGMGKEGVCRLKNSRVLIIGCGALGSLSAMYLAASGVGTIDIADFDTIDISNLQRQLFFSEELLGKYKVSALADRMKALNSGITVNALNMLVTPKWAEDNFSKYDFIIDGSDNGRTKVMTSSVCESTGVPCCIGGVNAFSGQVISWKPGMISYRELFGENVGCDGMLPCSMSGVLGPAAGVVASVQSSETIKHLANCGEMLYNRLFVFNLKDMTTSVIAVG